MTTILRVFNRFGLWLVAANLSLAWAATDIHVYVSRVGNNQWSGRLASPSQDGQDGPLASLDVALNQAAQLRQADAAGRAAKINIWLRGGAYELAEPVVLTPRDSGVSAELPLTIGAYQNEKPVLSGGRRLSGWKRTPGQPQLWTTTVPEVRAGQWYFRQLFIDGQRQIRARTPNDGYFRIQGKSPQDQPVQLHYRPGDLKKEWAERGDVEVIAYLSWADFRLQIRSVDDSNHVAVLSGNAAPSNKEDNAQYYIENAPDLLDSPGEWYLDRRTGVVTYWARPGEDLSQAEVVAPRLTELLRFDGDLAGQKPVQYVVLRGLTLAHTDWTLEDRGYTDTQAAFGIHGAIRATGATDCVIQDCTLTHLAGYALELGQGCQRCQVVGNEIVDIGGGGIRVGEPAKRQNPFELNHSHQITDNHLYQLGRVYAPAVGMLVLQSGQNRIAYNHIHDLYYTAISVGWNWGYQETPCRENIIEFNHLHDIGQYRLSDMGAIYTLGIQHGTVIRNNLIHDVYSFTYGGWGIYPDEGSTDILIENNVVYRTKSAGFHQHYGRENIVRNNIFAFGRENQLMRSRAESHISFVFEQNLVYFDTGNLLGSNWSNDNYRINRNLYFDARAGATAESMRFAGATLEQWRQRGHDRDSLIADPLFVDPGKSDFRLRPESPAFQLGFKPIDVSRVGVRKPADR